MEKPDFPFGGWMMFSTDAEERHKASAGGAVSQITRYLLDTKNAGTALGFQFDNRAGCFRPQWIYAPEEVKPVGSIYHEIKVTRFLKESIDRLKPPLVMVALPCQVKSIQAICRQNDIPVFVIALVCSGQLSMEATSDLFRRVAPGREIAHYRYRGNGWPSGIQILCADGQHIFLKNNCSPWMDLFHATVYNLKKCFSCKDTFGMQSDITIGDPWLPRYVQKETEGVSMCMPRNRRAAGLLERMLAEKRLALKEIISSEEVVASQRGTIEKKAIYRSYPKSIALLRRLYRHPLYFNMVFMKNLQRHTRLHRKCMNLLKMI